MALREQLPFLRTAAGDAGVDAAFGAPVSPSAEIVPTTVFTWTVAPSATLMSCKIPAAGAGISASTLSVEISNRGSSRCTLSPGFLSHLVIVPSKIDSPIWGMTISVGIVPFHAAPASKTGAHANLHYIYPAQSNGSPEFDRDRVRRGAQLVMMGVALSFRGRGRRRGSNRLLPVFLHGGWQFFDAGKEGRHFPHFLFR